VVVDGMLYAVRLVPGHTAQLTYDDLKKAYRNLDADRAAGRTGYNAIASARRNAEEENTVQDEEIKCGGHAQIPMKATTLKDRKTAKLDAIAAEIGDVLAAWVVVPGTIARSPVSNVTHALNLASITAGLKGVQDVIYALQSIPLAGRDRNELVSALATVLVMNLDNGQRHNHAAWCKLIWDAWAEQRAGGRGLASLGNLLRRTMVASKEWVGLKNPAAQLWAWRRAAMANRLGMLGTAGD
jgi:hypothetical protein